MAPAHHSSPSTCFRVLDTAVVTPAGPPLPPSSLPLTHFDLQWLHAPPVERLFFYRRPHHDTTSDQLTSSLKASLSAALRLYFPLAGHLRLTPGTAARHDIFYQPGDGVSFTLAEYHDGADLASDRSPRQVIELAKLVPRLHHTVDAGAAILAVQATVLLPRGDLALGVTVHHAACDGAGSTAFLRTWAAACAGADSLAPPSPVIDRTLVADDTGLYDLNARNLPSTDQWEFVKTSPDQLLATFTLSTEQLQAVKDAVAGAAARRGLTTPRCSALVAALGLVWSCYRRAKPADDAEATAYFILPVDHRKGMNVPAAYLGNCLGPAIAAAPCKDLACAGEAGLFAACAAIAAAIDKAVATPEWETLLERVKEAGAGGALSVAGSPRFRVYDVDFGFGPPAKVDIVSVARTGAVAVAESGRGGIQVGMSFSPAGMEVFQRCFADGVACLSPSSTCGAAAYTS